MKKPPYIIPEIWGSFYGKILANIPNEQTVPVFEIVVLYINVIIEECSPISTLN
jgi:hypothetical protein